MIKKMQGFWTLLSQDEQDVLRNLGVPRDYLVGVTLCNQGDLATHVFILLAGWVKILSTTQDGHEIVLALRGDGDIVGEIGGEIGQRNATIRSISKVRALTVPYDKFQSFLDANLGAGHAYRSVVTHRWNDTDAILRIRAVTTGKQRLAALLLDLAGRHGHATNNGVIELRMPLSQEELASLAGTSRATVTRTFDDWRQRGLIRTATHRITIIDEQVLRRIAASAMLT
ncbi:MAG: Crp/Fnr family transcriptional regulator [Streptosporangiaceae bacterium]